MKRIKLNKETTKKFVGALDEFVVDSWSSSNAFVPSIRALKRKILKWKLPVGAKVRLTDRLIGDDYTFIIKK